MAHGGRAEDAFHVVCPSMPGYAFSEAELQRQRELAAWWEGEGAYGQLHGTKPQTLGYGLTDSPAGLAAWIVEKLRSWSDCNGSMCQAIQR